MQTKPTEDESNISKSIKNIVDEKVTSKDCILDPSIFPYLKHMKKCDFTTIWIPDIRNFDREELTRALSNFTDEEIDIGYLLDVVGSGRLGNAEVILITDEHVDRDTDEKIRKNLDRVNDVYEREIFGNLLGKIIGGAKRLGHPIFFHGRKLLKYVRRIGSTILDVSNKFTREKQEFFKRVTGQYPRETRGIRFVGSAVGIVIGTMIPPVGLAMDIGFLILDP